MVGETYIVGQGRTQVCLEIVGYLEPNNGRELWESRLSIGGVNHDFLFRGSPALNFQLQSFQFCSPDQSICFVPAETEAFYIRRDLLCELPIPSTSSALAYLPYSGLSTLTFQGNCFAGQTLVVVHTDCVHICKGGAVTTHSFAGQVIVHYCCHDNQLSLSLRDLSRQSTTEKLISL